MADTELTPRERRRIKRNDEICAEAMQMIVEVGLEGFSVNKLAARVDLTPGALYRYFDSRDAILAAVEIEVLEHFDAYFERLCERCVDTGALRQVVVLSLGYVALQKLQPERFGLIAAFVAGPDPVIDDELAAGVVGPTLRVLGRFVTAVEGAQERRELCEGDALSRAALIWSSLQGFINHRKLTRLPQVNFEPGALLEELLQTLLRGWGADTSTVQACFEDLPSLEFYRTIMEENR